MLERTDRAGMADEVMAETMISPKRISWGAIIAGTVLALGISFLFNLLGVGIGMSTIDPGKGGVPSADTLGIGAAAWWVISSLVALFIGGFAAARLGGVRNQGDAVLHGLVTWGVVTLITFYLLTTAVGGLIGGAFSALTSGASAMGQGLSQAATVAAQNGGGDANQLGPMIDRMVAEVAPGTDPQRVTQAREQLTGLLPRVIQGGQPADEARRDAVRIIADLTGVPPEQAEQRFNQQMAAITQQATEVADTTANVVSAAAIWSFVAVLLGAIATAIGSTLGAKAADGDGMMSMRRPV